ncbi:SDR family oxidoreductase [Athalassotoga saccharophila]|uniref:SDR family oxidoreductase n=1 Tax=Athalassotoga saccharophila TaxID=1441386 RepID=UPI00137A31B7|nr:SDR family oxidoreductase [Athalassotoga saccharophila]BBJ28763.1 3-oxoacyl-[acyl-carrier-protein] reductase FabG [Athalassotoga saccharophila]
MDLGLNGKIVFVGGGSKGIGKAVAEEFAKEGAVVHIVSRHNTDEVAKEISSKYGSKVTGHNADLSIEKDVKRLFKEIGNVDVLFINTGGPKPGDLEDLTDEDWHIAYDLTMMSAVRLINAFLPGMISKKWGRVIASTSVSVYEPIPRLLLSNSIRMAVIGLMRSLSQEHGAKGITFNCIAPGYTLTERIKTLFEDTAKKRGITFEEASKSIVEKTDIKRLAKPEEIAAIVAFLASERASYITGTTIRVDGGYVASTL